MGGAEKKIGSASAGLRYLGLFAALAPSPAFAGAWIAPEDGQRIFTFAAGERDGVGVYESSSYLEMPLSKNTSYVSAPWFENFQEATPDGGVKTVSHGEITLGLKQALLRTDHAAMAVEGSAIWRSDPGRGCDEAGVEVRWLGGASFGPGHRQFLNVEAAERASQPGCTEGRVDVTVGRHLDEHWLGLAEVFTDAPEDGDMAVKAQLTLVRLGHSGKGVQFGVRAKVDGGVSEPSLVIGFWGRPRR